MYNLMQLYGDWWLSTNANVLIPIYLQSGGWCELLILQTLTIYLAEFIVAKIYICGKKKFDLVANN